MIMVLSGLRKPHFKEKKLWYKIRLEINSTEGSGIVRQHTATREEPVAHQTQAERVGAAVWGEGGPVVAYAWQCVLRSCV